jgi:fumarylacetoacetase
MKLDETHDPALRSWVASANAADGDFPIQNLPYAVFRRRGDNAPPRVGVAIGAEILDIAAVADLMHGGRDPPDAGRCRGTAASGADR